MKNQPVTDLLPIPIETVTLSLPWRDMMALNLACDLAVLRCEMQRDDPTADASDRANARSCLDGIRQVQERVKAVVFERRATTPTPAGQVSTAHASRR